MFLLRWYSTAHTVIKELQDEAIDPQSLLNSRGATRKQELMLLIKNLEEALKELDEIIKRYEGLARRERRIWNQLRLATEDLDMIRSKLTFHVIAINAFTSSLSRGTLAQIETVLLDLVSEVRQGRRQPSLTSLHETNNDSLWKELESELAGDGISSIDVVKHKAAIKVFVQGLLSDSNPDTISLVEVASLPEFGNDNTDTESLWHGLFAMEISTGDPVELLTTPNAQNGSLASMDAEKYESADEELSPADAGASNPTIRPRLAGPVRTPPKFVDALGYVSQLETQFIYQRDTYNQFLDIMKSFERKALDVPGVIDWVSSLLVCHPEFIQNFNTFLPDRYTIKCGTVDNRYAFQVIMPFTAYIRIPDLQAMQSLTVRGDHLHIGLLKWIDPASLDILRPYPRIAAPLDWTTDQPASRTSGVIEARMTFLGRLKALLARLKATKEAAIHTGLSDEINGTNRGFEKLASAQSGPLTSSTILQSRRTK